MCGGRSMKQCRTPTLITPCFISRKVYKIPWEIGMPTVNIHSASSLLAPCSHSTIPPLPSAPEDGALSLPPPPALTLR